MITKITHVGITVANLDRSLEFYRDALECRILWRSMIGANPDVRELVGVCDAEIEGAMLQTPGGFELELVHFLQPIEPAMTVPTSRPAATHIAFSVSAMGEAVTRLTAFGATFISEPVHLPSGIFVYCRDPDNVILELIESTS